MEGSWESWAHWHVAQIGVGASWCQDMRCSFEFIWLILDAHLARVNLTWQMEWLDPDWLSRCISYGINGGWFQPALLEGRCFCPSTSRLRFFCTAHAPRCPDGRRCSAHGWKHGFFPNPPSLEPWILWVPSEAFFLFGGKSMIFGQSFPWQVVFPPKKARGFWRDLFFNAAQPALQKGFPFEVSISDFLRTKILGLVFFSTL